MRLGPKILLTTTVTFTGFMAALFFISHLLLLGSFERYEERDTALNAERALSALEGEIENLHSFNLDWASWDDSYAFVRERGAEYIQSNLNVETLAKQRLNLIIYLDASGKVVFAKALDHYSMGELPVTGELLSLPAHGGLATDGATENSKSGIIGFGARFMMVSTRPITKSDGGGPARGTLAMARYLDEKEIGQLAEKTHLTLSIVRYDATLAQQLGREAKHPLAQNKNIITVAPSRDSIEGYAVVRDLSASPAFWLKVELPRVIYGQGRKGLAHFMVYLFAAALISTAAILVFLKLNVLSRVAYLSRAARDIGRTGNLSERVKETGQDELSELSQEVNRMLGSLERLEWERKRAEEEIRAAKDELELRVAARTAELLEKNIELGDEVAERKRVEEAMKEMVYHDYLTGLPNRLLFTDRLNQVIAGRYKAKDMTAAVLFMDMDRFKVVNDSLGHAAGDELIKAVARLTKEALREGDTVARIGGDEFTILLRDLGRAEDIPLVVERIFEGLSRPIDLMGSNIFITVSIGIAVYPYDGADSTALMKNADIAMYQAKSKGGNRFEMYNPEMAQKTIEKLTIGNKLRSALEQGNFVLHYQAQYDLRKKRFTAAEALIRLQDRELGLVSPMTFIPIAEETGLIVPVGEWCLRTACSLNKRLNGMGLDDIGISVNISPRMFGEPGFTKTVVDVIDQSGIDPRYLMLEITEGLLMANLLDAARTIRDLRSAGVRFSVDDFGTGYSSLAYLKNLAINELKIDRSFIKDLTKHPDDRLITKAIINLAHSLNLEVIAEGVETREQLDFLVEHNCDAIQGFYYSKPLPEKEFMQLIMETNGKVG